MVLLLSNAAVVPRAGLDTRVPVHGAQYLQLPCGDGHHVRIGGHVSGPDHVAALRDLHLRG